jgi:hypothetical protein
MIILFAVLIAIVILVIVGFTVFSPKKGMFTVDINPKTTPTGKSLPVSSSSQRMLVSSGTSVSSSIPTGVSANSYFTYPAPSDATIHNNFYTLMQGYTLKEYCTPTQFKIMGFGLRFIDSSSNQFISFTNASSSSDAEGDGDIFDFCNGTTFTATVEAGTYTTFDMLMIETPYGGMYTTSPTTTSDPTKLNADVIWAGMPANFTVDNGNSSSPDIVSVSNATLNTLLPATIIDLAGTSTIPDPVAPVSISTGCPEIVFGSYTVATVDNPILGLPLSPITISPAGNYTATILWNMAAPANSGDNTTTSGIIAHYVYSGSGSPLTSPPSDVYVLRPDFLNFLSIGIAQN